VTRYWKAWAALGAGLLVLVVAAIFFPSNGVLVTAAVTSVAASLGALAAPKNTP
jgi:uncharacterized membrane protein YdfJ with MMPL/SSD domain